MARTGDQEENDGRAEEHDNVHDFEAIWRDGAKECDW